MIASTRAQQPTKAFPPAAFTPHPVCRQVAVSASRSLCPGRQLDAEKPPTEAGKASNVRRMLDEYPKNRFKIDLLKS